MKNLLQKLLFCVLDNYSRTAWKRKDSKNICVQKNIQKDNNNDSRLLIVLFMIYQNRHINLSEIQQYSGVYKSSQSVILWSVSYYYESTVKWI